MPKVTIWIRDKDYEKWSAIDDKPQFISDAINADTFIKKINNVDLVLPKNSDNNDIHFGKNAYEVVDTNADWGA